MDRDAILLGLLQELRRGTIVLCVLKRLKNPMYGYHLVSEMSASGIEVEANTLYPLLRRLEAQGLLSSSWELGETKPRKYYVRTEAGAEICERLSREWKKIAASMNDLLEE